jgi:hypothetical protein
VNIKINEAKTRAIYFTRRNRPPDSLLTLNGRNIPFVNSMKYLGVIFDKKIAWRLHIEMIEAKAFRTFVRIYFLFKSERLSSNIKLTLHKALIRYVMTYLNYWVMHPVARVLISIYRNLRTQQMSVLVLLCTSYTTCFGPYWWPPSNFLYYKPPEDGHQ